MRIIKPPELHLDFVSATRCTQCSCVFEYHESDINDYYSTYTDHPTILWILNVICPGCNNVIEVNHDVPAIVHHRIKNRE